MTLGDGLSAYAGFTLGVLVTLFLPYLRTENKAPTPAVHHVVQGDRIIIKGDVVYDTLVVDSMIINHSKIPK